MEYVNSVLMTLSSWEAVIDVMLESWNLKTNCEVLLCCILDRVPY